MKKLTIYFNKLPEYNKTSFNSLLSDFKNAKELIDLEEYLLINILNLSILKNNLIVNPNYKLINCFVTVFFRHNNLNHKLIIDGQNNCIIVDDVKLKNINSVSLKNLQTKKIDAQMF